MKRKINLLVNEFKQGRIDRRIFLKKLGQIAGSSAVALSIFPMVSAQFGLENENATKFSELNEKMMSYPGETGDVLAYFAAPAVDTKLPAVIVIHENKGLQPHIKDVTRRMAQEGFIALAPDALSPLGGTPENDVDTARTKMRELDREETTKNFVAAVKYLNTHPKTTGKVGCTGFCWGGAMTNQVAVHAPDLNAAVPYYGSQPSEEDVPKIKAAIMAHYAGNDERINKGIEAFENALKKAGIEYKIFIYEGASHAFNNDANPSRYHKEAASLAWKRTIEFFKEKLA